MAHGEAARPLETTDAKSVDSSQQLGSSSLHTVDSRVIELLEQLLEINKKILLALEIQIGETIE